jgi:hypothetical protein
MYQLAHRGCPGRGQRGRRCSACGLSALLHSQFDRVRAGSVDGDGKVALDRNDKSLRVARLEYAADAASGKRFVGNLDLNPGVSIDAANGVAQWLGPENDLPLAPGRGGLKIGFRSDRRFAIPADP